MTHAFVTIIARVPLARVGEVRAKISALGNPAAALAMQQIDALGIVHFSSLNVFESSAGDCGHLVFEFSADGMPDKAIDAMGSAIGAQLEPIFAEAENRGSGTLANFWKSHVVDVGGNLFSNPGVCFAGTPLMSVARIRGEAALAAALSGIIAGAPTHRSALESLSYARSRIEADPKLKWALEPEPMPAETAAAALPDGGIGVVGVVFALLPAFARGFLWPFVVPWLALLVGLFIWRTAGTHGSWYIYVYAAFHAAWVSTLIAVLAIAAIAGVLYLIFRRAEAADLPLDRQVDHAFAAQIMKHENFAAQNHMAALSVMKDGWLRRLTLRLAFWVIGQFAIRYYQPGFLGPLGTIHFARWVTVPGTKDLIFLSNYGGSWESYLEDFITKAHAGLTGVWSNTREFPATRNLFLDGATDGERFKRWARRQQIPTQFWYTAYPALTTANIRINAHIRAGLAAAMTEDEARKWLLLFGSAVRPLQILESNEIQSLILGGLGFLTEGMCLALELGSDVKAAKDWLADILPDVAFADGRSLLSAVFLALSPAGFAKLGVPEEALATFPPTYLDGMTASWRSRVLGDQGADDPDHWWWGGHKTVAVDAVLLLYGQDKECVAKLLAKVRADFSRYNVKVVREIPFEPLPAKDSGESKKEPFGFVDGISQPLIRGTYKSLRNADPIHLVEPGEFILGYPDNRGNLPPDPTLPVQYDPAGLLPVAASATPGFAATAIDVPRDFGRNGSYLVIRQLEQDVAGFKNYCKETAATVAGQFSNVKEVTGEYIAAKIVGRWPDGSPLVRYPHRPATEMDTGSHPLSRTVSVSVSPIHTVAPPRYEKTPVPNKAATAKEEKDKEEKMQAEFDQPKHERTPLRLPFTPDNDFLFGKEDPQGMRCPYGAHIRRANPRESFAPGSDEQLSITNRHRILRIGRFYHPQPGEKEGLFFMCLNGDIERQFEFVQQTWIQAASFHGLAGEADPLLGGPTPHAHTIPTPERSVRLANLPDFVRMRGGGYFFMPGKRTLAFLSTEAVQPKAIKGQLRNAL